MADENPPETCDIRSGTIGGYLGFKYEILIGMLLLFRGVTTDEIVRFNLYQNIGGVGNFDDLVFIYTYKKDGSIKTEVIFIQAKHKENTNFVQSFKYFLSEKDEFLRKCLDSHILINQRLNNGVFNSGSIDSIKYIIFTNAKYNLDECDADVTILPIDENDILNLNMENASYCKLNYNESVNTILEYSPNFKKLANLLSQSVKSVKSEIKANNHIFNVYKTALLNNVLEIRRNEEIQEIVQFKLKNNFLNDKNGDLTKIILEEAEKKFKKSGEELKKTLENQVINVNEGNFKDAEESGFEIALPNQKFTSEEIEDFCNKCRIFYNQPNEEGLQEKLIKEISLKYSLEERVARRVFLDVYNSLETWRKGNECLSKSNKYFERAVQNAFKWFLGGLVSKRKEVIKKLKIEFNDEHVETLVKRISSKNILHISTTNTVLTIAKVYQASEIEYKSQENSDYKYILMDSVIGIENRVILDAFKSENTLLLVFECKSTEDKKIEELYKGLKKIIKDDPNKKIIMIIEANKIDTKFEECFSGLNYEKFTDETKNLDYLTKDSQDHLINQVDAIFQGKTESLGKLLEDENTRKFVDEEILTKLVTNSRITIGKDFINLNENKECINRKFSKDYSVKEEDMINIKDKVVIINAEPEMGKCTLLKLAQYIKESDTFLWVEIINLYDHKNHFKKEDINKDNKKDKAINKLLHMVDLKSDLDKEIFTSRIKDKGNIVLLFHNLSLIYNEQVSEFLDGLNDTKAQLWITTEPHLKNELEKKFGVTSYNLEPLTKEDQVTILKNIWKPKLGLNIGDDERFDSYVRNLLDLLITDTALTLTEEEQIKMLAEIFQDIAIKCFNDSKLPNLSERMDLYEKFIKKKSLDYIHSIKDLMEIMNFDKNHKLLAINSIFHDDLDKILSPKEQKYLNQIKDDFEGRKEKTQIVQVINGEPIFSHQIFPEHFSATWFAEKLKENNKEIEIFVNQNHFKNKYKFLYIFLDKYRTRDD